MTLAVTPYWKLCVETVHVNWFGNSHLQSPNLGSNQQIFYIDHFSFKVLYFLGWDDVTSVRTVTSPLMISWPIKCCQMTSWLVAYQKVNKWLVDKLQLYQWLNIWNVYITSKSYRIKCCQMTSCQMKSQRTTSWLSYQWQLKLLHNILLISLQYSPNDSCLNYTNAMTVSFLCFWGFLPRERMPGLP